ncbi:MAG: hypothetical protein K0R38_6803, partial [Polyangiaceae bacterium]|nr:hypothetical protein [Polyangiaceae bacterium]
MMKGLKCLGKKFAKSKSFGKLLSKVGLCNSPGEPINPFTGEVYNDFEDYRDPETGFVWERHYRSGWNEQDGPLGFGFRHFFQRTLTLLRKRAIYETHDGEVMALLLESEGSWARSEGFELSILNGQHYELTTDRAETLLFELQTTTPPCARMTRYRRGAIDVHLFYERDGRLRALSEYAVGGIIDTHLIYDQSQRVEQVVRGPRGSTPLAISHYRYLDGCIVDWHDIFGFAAHMSYDSAHRMVRGTDRRGYSFHWQYDATNGRCTNSRGDDGVLGVTASYAGNRSTFIEPDGGEWRFKHYTDGSISHIIDPYGGIKEYARNDGGRIVKQVEPTGEEYVWLYDEAGKHVGRRDRWGNNVPPEDDVPLPPNPRRHDGPTTQKGWLAGEVLCLTPVRIKSLPSPVAASLAPHQARAGVAAVARVRRDLLGREIERTYPDGTVERFAYDAEGNLIHSRNTRGGSCARKFASWNLLESEQTGEGSLTRYEYTHRRKRRSVIDANGNHFDYERDLRQYVVRILHNGTQYLRYERGVHGRVVAEYDDRDQPLVRYETDPTGLPVKATLTSGEVFAYARDEDGNLIDASSKECRIQRSFVGSLPASDLRDEVGTTHEYDRNLALQR